VAAHIRWARRAAVLSGRRSARASFPVRRLIHELRRYDVHFHGSGKSLGQCAAPGSSGLQAQSVWSIMNVLRTSVIRMGRPVHKMLRGQKLDLFFRLICDSPKSTLLDVGGGTGIDSEFVPLYRAFQNVMVVNLTPPPSELRSLLNVTYEVADGCTLPYDSKSFDWVFSNAVLEHVGSPERQRKFADEIRRVAKCGYFVTTPNKRFTIEPHSLLPFYRFLSHSWQRRVVRFSPYYLEHYEEIRLLNAFQLSQLFPEAIVRSIGFSIVGTSLVAMFRDPQHG